MCTADKLEKPKCPSEALTEEERKILEVRMTEYYKKREERLREMERKQAERKKKWLEELAKNPLILADQKLQRTREELEEQEYRKIKALCEKQTMELHEIEERKKRTSVFREIVKERYAKAAQTVEEYEAEMAAKTAERESEEQERRAKKEEEKRKKGAYEQRKQQRRASLTHGNKAAPDVRLRRASVC